MGVQTFVRIIVPMLILLALSIGCKREERKTSREFPLPKLQPLEKIEGYIKSDTGIVVPKYEMLIRPRGRLNLRGIDLDLDLRDNRIRTYEILNDKYFLVTLFPDSLKNSLKLYRTAKDDMRIVALANPRKVYEAKLGRGYIVDVEDEKRVVIAWKYGMGFVEIPMRRLDASEWSLTSG
jgi:hypothetical protein